MVLQKTRIGHVFLQFWAHRLQNSGSAFRMTSVSKRTIDGYVTGRLVTRGNIMPTKETMERVKQDKREGKSPSTQAGEFIKETIDDIRSGRYGARSTKQAIAIGLSKARRAGVDLPPPKKGTTSDKTRKSAAAAYRAGHENPNRPVSRKRSKATTAALQREGDTAASHESLSRQAKQQASKRTAA